MLPHKSLHYLFLPTLPLSTSHFYNGKVFKAEYLSLYFLYSYLSTLTAMFSYSKGHSPREAKFFCSLLISLITSKI